MMLVSYYQIPTGRNAGIVVAFGAWPARILRHRGWTNDKRIYQRGATPAEYDWLRNCMRYQAFRYESVDGLLEDEKQVLEIWPDIFESLKTRFTENELTKRQ